MAVENVLEACDLASLSDSFADRLRQAQSLFDAETGLADERSWIETALDRVEAAQAALNAALLRAEALPELGALRKTLTKQRLEVWVDNLEHLLGEITEHFSERAPIIEILYPHLKLAGLRRGGKSAESFATEFERRANSTYIQRVLVETDYSFLKPALDDVRSAYLRYQQCSEPSSLASEEAEALRGEVVEAARALEQNLRQARCLAEAALVSFDEAFESLGFKIKLKKRPASQPV